MSDLITRSDDERLENFRVQVPAQGVGLIVASLRASLQREEAERAERDDMTAERDAALLRAEKAEAIVKRIEVEGLAKRIAYYVCCGVNDVDDYWESIPAGPRQGWIETATVFRSYLLEGK